MLTKEQQERYKRNLLLPELGEEGQEKLLKSRVLIIGAGGLGSPVALYLAAAGVGTLGIVDSDCLDLSNLQRQILHTTADVGRHKVDSAREHINALNPDVKVVTYYTYFNKDTADQIIAGYDIVVDATDNSQSKFFINDVCVAAGKPLVHGAINQFSGNVMTILPGTANYRDLFDKQPQNPASSATYGLLGAIPGIIGTIQATEVLKFLIGTGELLTNQILHIDAKTMTFAKFKIK
jgi:molybdopterin/thiamine biosynthesis adenylyltransferase